MAYSSPKQNRIARRLDQLPLFCYATVAIAAARLALLVLPLRVIKRSLWRLMSANGRSRKARSLDQVLWACRAGAKYSVAGTTCLATALVSQVLLLRHGYEASLRIGVRREDSGAFAAHAWLERDNVVIIGGPLSNVKSFTPLPDVERLLV